MGPMRMTEAFLKNVLQSDRRIIAFLSSKMGSISDNTSGGSYMYRSSKAALNAVVKSLSLDLKDRGVIAVALHPGWVKTDMGGKDAPTLPRESIQGMRKVLQDLRQEDTGKFLSYDGSEVPW
jgi:NAD(P)-dependent dehydrogenase (short-subunit alcohol dehydrogenase family)